VEQPAAALCIDNVFSPAIIARLYSELSGWKTVSALHHEADDLAGMLPPTTIVVPCYNEAERFSSDAFGEFAAAHPSVHFVFVNDGSTDQTPLMLSQLVSAAPERFERLDHPHNRGKAAAVRSGMLRAFASGRRYAGYWDADLATPLSEIPRFIESLETHPHREICFGVRVQLLGRTIRRRFYRHYLGRVFATAASLALQLPVYDTQCGAKLFRASPDMHALFEEPFLVNWTFDVEIIARLTQQRRRTRRPGPLEIIYELPVEEWRDIEGSKVHPHDFVTALSDVVRIRRKYLRDRH
jgi:dolichyl-phosphate beta-glucosyltransferase